jgi:hypothetical protein
VPFDNEITVVVRQDTQAVCDQEVYSNTCFRRVELGRRDAVLAAMFIQKFSRVWHADGRLDADSNLRFQMRNATANALRAECRKR